MAGNIQQNYGTNTTTFTITLASLTQSSVRNSSAVDNSSNEYMDALVVLKIKTGGSNTSSAGVVNVYAYGTVDGGTTYTDGVNGTDSAFTPTSPTNLKPIGQLNAVANATTYIGGPWSIAAAFGGVMPAKWGIVVENKTGGTLDGTEGNHVKEYQGVYMQYT